MGLQTVTQTVLVTTIVTAVTVFGTIIYKKWKNIKIPSSWEKAGNVKKIHLYPLKSGHRIELEKAEVTEVGLQQSKEDEKVLQLRDRGLVVYGAKDNEFRTARTYPKMLFIDVAVHDETHLAIDAPTMRTLYVKVPNRKNNNVVKIKAWNNERIDGIDCGDEAASWLSRYIIERDTGLRLAYSDASQQRDITKTHEKILTYYKNLGNASTGLFSDLTSVSLVSQPSVTDLNLKIGGNSAITVEQFRHNIVVDGTKIDPYEEDDWEWIKVGNDVVLRNVKACTRCSLSTIDPEKGTKDPQHEPLKTLNTFRQSLGPDNGPRLGVNLEVRRTGIIRLGDPVYVSRSGANENK